VNLSQAMTLNQVSVQKFGLHV